MNAQLEQLAEWGYRVDLAQQTDDDVDVYFVEGFGVALYVRADDENSLANLTNPDAQAERVRQYEEAT